VREICLQWWADDNGSVKHQISGELCSFVLGLRIIALQLFCAARSIIDGSRSPRSGLYGH
jgi:hypothetical protein